MEPPVSGRSSLRPTHCLLTFTQGESGLRCFAVYLALGSSQATEQADLRSPGLRWLDAIAVRPQATAREFRSISVRVGLLNGTRTVIALVARMRRS